jgi:hypothetical protein
VVARVRGDMSCALWVCFVRAYVRLVYGLRVFVYVLCVCLSYVSCVSCVSCVSVWWWMELLLILLIYLFVSSTCIKYTVVDSCHNVTWFSKVSRPVFVHMQSRRLGLRRGSVPA